MADTFSTIAIVALVLGVVLLIAAAIIFVKLKIWIVMADLSGKTAQMSIEQIRNRSEQPAKRVQHRSYVVNSSVLKRNKGTDELRPKGTEQIGKLFGKKTDILKKTEETVPLKSKQNTEKLDGKKPKTDPDATAILGTTNAATEGTAILYADDNDFGGTEVLAEGTTADYTATTVLRGDATTVIDSGKKKAANFRIITDIVMTHTNETIN